jgi:hypothetical protein
MQQVAVIDSQLSQLNVQLGQLQTAGGETAYDTGAAQDSADDSLEEEMTPVLSRSQRHRRRMADARRHAATAAATATAAGTAAVQSSQPSQPQQLQRAPTLQLPQPQPQPQRQQQSQLQLSQGPGRLGMSVLELPMRDEAFPVSFKSEAAAEQRRLTQQQAQLVAQLEDMEMDSDESDTPPSSEENYVLAAKYGIEQGGSFDGADAWFVDEGVFDSSDDVSVIADSDSD